MWRNNSTAGSIHVETDWLLAATEQRDNITQNGGAYRGELELANQLQCQLGMRCGVRSDRLGVVFSRFLRSNQIY